MPHLAFTLIELLIVVTIIAIFVALFSIPFVSFQKDRVTAIAIDYFEVAPVNQAPANITVWGRAQILTFAAVVLRRVDSNNFEGIVFGTLTSNGSGIQWTANLEAVPAGTYYLTAFEMDGSSDTTAHFTIPSSE
jgi:prepilin-type N-terminal cleavage/methylation domain-containing protein